jgi:hypothetical protein
MRIDWFSCADEDSILGSICPRVLAAALTEGRFALGTRPRTTLRFENGKENTWLQRSVPPATHAAAYC